VQDIKEEFNKDTEFLKSNQTEILEWKLKKSNEKLSEMSL
jgi:hypothetical protein